MKEQVGHPIIDFLAAPLKAATIKIATEDRNFPKLVSDQSPY